MKQRKRRRIVFARVVEGGHRRRRQEYWTAARAWADEVGRLNFGKPFDHVVFYWA